MLIGSLLTTNVGWPCDIWIAMCMGAVNCLVGWNENRVSRKLIYSDVKECGCLRICRAWNCNSSNCLSLARNVCFKGFAFLRLKISLTVGGPASLCCQFPMQMLFSHLKLWIGVLTKTRLDVRKGAWLRGGHTVRLKETQRNTVFRKANQTASHGPNSDPV